jgi:hypothetical protein
VFTTWEVGNYVVNYFCRIVFFKRGASVGVTAGLRVSIERRPSRAKMDLAALEAQAFTKDIEKE